MALIPLVLPVPAEWVSLLRSLDAEAPGQVFIAGGALRDVDNGIPVKDLDVWFLHQQTRTKAISVMQGLGAIRLSDTTEGNSGADPQRARRLSWHVPLTMPDSLKVDLIGCNPDVENGLEGLLQSFDYTICQIGLAPTGRVYTTEAYAEDKAAKILRRVREQWSGEDRLTRLQTKFPGWQVVK